MACGGSVRSPPDRPAIPDVCKWLHHFNTQGLDGLGMARSHEPPHWGLDALQ
jgi:hypothetical protein